MGKVIPADPLLPVLSIGGKDVNRLPLDEKTYSLNSGKLSRRVDHLRDPQDENSLLGRRLELMREVDGRYPPLT